MCSREENKIAALKNAVQDGINSGISKNFAIIIRQEKKKWVSFFLLIKQ